MMDSLTIFISIFVIWIASFCKLLYASLSPSRSASFASDAEKTNVLLVIAHPDDESMFFAPSINHLTSRGHNLHILCLSTGNADDMGKIRTDELYKASATLKIPVQQVKVINHPDLQDGFGKKWNHSLIAKYVKEEVISRSINLVLTFDRYGVSGHCNHRDVHTGIRQLLLDSQERKLEAWELITTSILRKYSGPLDIWPSSLIAKRHPGEICFLLNEHPLRSFRAMAQHASQWVWFRKLFVSFSSYTYMNSLRRIKT